MSSRACYMASIGGGAQIQAIYHVGNGTAGSLACASELSVSTIARWFLLSCHFPPEITVKNDSGHNHPQVRASHWLRSMFHIRTLGLTQSCLLQEVESYGLPGQQAGGLSLVNNPCPSFDIHGRRTGRV